MAHPPSWHQKDWARILAELSSPESSDAEDELNVMQVQKNAKRVAELVHQVVPGLSDLEHLRGLPPMGANNANLIRDGLAASMRTQSQFAAARRRAPGEADASAAPPPPPVPAPPSTGPLPKNGSAA